MQLQTMLTPRGYGASRPNIMLMSTLVSFWCQRVKFGARDYNFQQFSAAQNNLGDPQGVA